MDTSLEEEKARFEKVVREIDEAMASLSQGKDYTISEVVSGMLASIAIQIATNVRPEVGVDKTLEVYSEFLREMTKDYLSFINMKKN